MRRRTRRTGERRRRGRGSATRSTPRTVRRSSTTPFIAGRGDRLRVRQEHAGGHPEGIGELREGFYVGPAVVAGFQTAYRPVRQPGSLGELRFGQTRPPAGGPDLVFPRSHSVHCNKKLNIRIPYAGTAAKPGRRFGGRPSVDVMRGEFVESELDRLIEKRHDRRVAEDGDAA